MHPIPRGRFVQGIVIDDLVGIYLVLLTVVWLYNRPEVELRLPGPDLESFDKMVAKYREVNLLDHEDKRVRRVTRGTFWGGRLLGIMDRAMAPPEKVLGQIVLTLMMIRLRAVPLLLVQIVVGGWISIFTFRRPLFSIFKSVVRDMQ